MSDKYRAYCTFDATERLGVRQLIETIDVQDFDKRIERLISFVAYIQPHARLHQMGSRLNWTIPRPKKYRPDNAEELIIVVLERGLVADKPIASQIELSTSIEISEAIDQLLSQGYDASAIPTLYANAAYCHLHKKGLVS